jgi:RNA polymerase-binding transcription factor DksA
VNIEAVREKLLAEKKRLEGELLSYKAEDPYLAQNRDLEINSIDNDSIENESHDRIAAIRNSLKRDLSEVMLALEKIDRGTYGQCEAGGHPIEEGRLLATPTARFCVQHAK